MTTEDELRALYPAPVERTWKKESPIVTAGYAELIAAAPFCVLATRSADGLDCSPRGDGPGFVRVADERTLLIPDRRGNNRLDTLSNLLECPDIGLIFLIPGVGETVRVRGAAIISTEPDLLSVNEYRGVRPTTVLVVTVHRIYFQCRRALLRSGLWDPGARVDPATLPSAGRLQTEVGAMEQTAADEYDAALGEYAAATLYEGPTKA